MERRRKLERHHASGRALVVLVCALVPVLGVLAVMCVGGGAGTTLLQVTVHARILDGRSLKPIAGARLLVNRGGIQTLDDSWMPEEVRSEALEGRFGPRAVGLSDQQGEVLVVYECFWDTSDSWVESLLGHNPQVPPLYGIEDIALLHPDYGRLNVDLALAAWKQVGSVQRGIARFRVELGSVLIEK